MHYPNFGTKVVKLFPREVPRVLNLFPMELIESTPKDYPARPSAKNPWGLRPFRFLAEGLAEGGLQYTLEGLH